MVELGFCLGCLACSFVPVLGFPESFPAWPSVSLGLWLELPFGSEFGLGCGLFVRVRGDLSIVIRVQCTVESTSSSNSSNLGWQGVVWVTDLRWLTAGVGTATR